MLLRWATSAKTLCLSSVAWTAFDVDFVLTLFAREAAVGAVSRLVMRVISEAPFVGPMFEAYVHSVRGLLPTCVVATGKFSVFVALWLRALVESLER